jgi:hypothetical protein
VSTTRIAGEWNLYINTISHTDKSLALDTPVAASLTVLVANRAVVEAEFMLNGTTVMVKGRVRPGTPSVLTLEECDSDGTLVDDGLETILYVPPWRPNIDYDFDILTGTIVIGKGSAIAEDNLKQRVMVLTGLQGAE